MHRANVVRKISEKWSIASFTVNGSKGLNFRTISRTKCFEQKLTSPVVVASFVACVRPNKKSFS